MTLNKFDIWWNFKIANIWHWITFNIWWHLTFADIWHWITFYSRLHLTFDDIWYLITIYDIKHSITFDIWLHFTFYNIQWHLIFDEIWHLKTFWTNTCNLLQWVLKFWRGQSLQVVIPVLTRGWHRGLQCMFLTNKKLK